MKLLLNKSKRNTLFLISLVIITFFGLVLRVISCDWGSPLQLHPDEPVIVDNAIDMLRRHSWEANVYNRPDHFEIKCDSIIFSIYSWVRYNMPAYEAFAEHKMAFYKLGRLFTAFFGTAMIPLVALFVGQLLRNSTNKNKHIAQITAAILTAFSCAFIEHSAYATPDIVLTFFILLFAFFVLKHLDADNGRNIYIYFCSYYRYRSYDQIYSCDFMHTIRYNCHL